ncbi:MAG: hypothetical protein FWH05_01390 [Oscillospiraceae bacterium]|nr:hypothetical protein [Oscillospiraceae bacterium]
MKLKSETFTCFHEIEQILDKTEEFGELCGLCNADKAKLRLLAEEMLGLNVRLFDELEFEFSLKNEGNRFTLKLSVNTDVSAEQKSQILSLATDGKNAAHKGILGKISGVFYDMLMISGNVNPSMSQMPITYGGVGNLMYFSMNEYREWLANAPTEEQWDGVEKSIIANIATDVKVGVKNNKVEMTTLADFSLKKGF